MTCYSLHKKMNKKDDRQKLWKKQRKKRGFDDTELWNLDKTFAAFIYPRLVEFAPPNNEIKKKVDIMIPAFEILKEDIFFLTDEQYNIVKKGLRAFADNFIRLWN